MLTPDGRGEVGVGVSGEATLRSQGLRPDLRPHCSVGGDDPSAAECAHRLTLAAVAQLQRMVYGFWGHLDM